MAAGSTYTPIATNTLGTAAPSITFSRISGSYTDLVLVTNSAAVTSGGGYTLTFRVGNSSVDTGTNYSWTQLIGDGSSASSGRNGSSPQNTFMFGGRIDDTPTFGTTIAHFMNYSNTTTYKTALINGGVANVRTGVTVNLWRSTSAINIITITNEAAVNFAVGSTFTLYGIAAA